MSKADPNQPMHEDLSARQGAVDDESFFRRWSTRKQQAETAVPKTATIDTDQAKPVSAPPELTDADMPPLESLDEKSDYSGFFSPKVSAELKRRALRKLFHSATFNVTDGLDDYAEDYTRFAALGDIITQDMRHMMDVIAKRDAQQAAEKDQTEPSSAHPEPIPSEETISVAEDTTQQDPQPTQSEHSA